eukprot:TRINITY_DN2997_c0_g1_i5.p1 TRINITY_DN2997_c0_g1~~TRINITY_DN2997_c0_g1_i5.p1  ORF type:complete len:328 (-),score=64.58 TRINITY_DN2997_c0_g1_i5:429-1412(-)
MLEYFEAGTGLKLPMWLSYISRVVIATCLTAVNLSGLEVVGVASLVVLVLVLIPFVLLALAGVDEMEPSAWGQWASNASYARLLHNVLWNFNGFDATSTMTGEVVTPHKTIPRALLMSTCLVILTYLIPVLVVTALDPDWQSYDDGHYTEVATHSVGAVLTAVFSASATLSCAGMYMAELASDSYQLSGMAEMGLVPRVFRQRSSGGDTPFVAISASYFFIVLLLMLPFSQLLEIDNWLYSASLILELGALVRLRYKIPVPGRPPGVFNIPISTKGLVGMYLPTLLLAGFSIVWCHWFTHALCLTICVFGVLGRFGMVWFKARHPLL